MLSRCVAPLASCSSLAIWQLLCPFSTCCKVSEPTVCLRPSLEHPFFCCFGSCLRSSPVQATEGMPGRGKSLLGLDAGSTRCALSAERLLTLVPP